MLELRRVCLLFHQKYQVLTVSTFNTINSKTELYSTIFSQCRLLSLDHETPILFGAGQNRDNEMDSDHKKPEIGIL